MRGGTIEIDVAGSPGAGAGAAARGFVVSRSESAPDAKRLGCHFAAMQLSIDLYKP
jgi:hypothetical protein